MSDQRRMIITGVSSGIGRAISAEALRLGWYVEGIGRNAPALLTVQPRENLLLWLREFPPASAYSLFLV